VGERGRRPLGQHHMPGAPPRPERAVARRSPPPAGAVIATGRDPHAHRTEGRGRSGGRATGVWTSVPPRWTDASVVVVARSGG